MEQKNFSFQSQNLTVDYITLNLRNGKNQITEIANIFNFFYSFNCYIFDNNKKYAKKQKIIFNNGAYELTFIINSSEYQSNTVLIQFSKLNASYLYEILKSGKFLWKKFYDFDLVLGRIDINYIRKKTINESIFLDFAKGSSEKYRRRYPQAIVAPVEKSSFGIGTRKGDYFLRVYETKDKFLKFELEIKKGKAKDYQIYLSKLPETFLEFEDLIATRFYQYLKTSLVLDTEFTDWLLVILRQTNKPKNRLISSYISENLKLEKKSFLQQKDFYRLLQLLSFIRNYPYVQETLNEEVFYSLTFPLSEFARDITLDKNITLDKKLLKSKDQPKKKINPDLRTDLVRFFEELREYNMIEWFSDEEFRSVVVFPVVEVRHKTPGNVHTRLIVKMSVSKNFFSSIQYPFYFPSHFYHYKNKDDMRVKLEILKSVASQVTIRKEFDVANLLLTLNSLSNQRISDVKKNIVQLFQSLQQTSLIETELTLYQENKSPIVTHKLTLAQIKKTKTIVFYETDKNFIEHKNF